MIKKFFCMLAAFALAYGQMNAATEKVHADFTDVISDGNAAWDKGTQTLSWSLPYDNTLKYIALPTGDYSNYEKIVVESADLEANSFSIYVYNGLSYTSIVVNESGLKEFRLKSYLTNSQLADITDIRLAGGTESSGSVRIVDLYVETYDDAVPRKKDPELSFSQSLVLLEVGEAFTAPTLNNPNNLPVTYNATSTPANAITVDATTGEVTLAEGELSGNVTATFDGNDEFEAGTASYAITVRKSSIEDGIPTHYSVENTAADNPDPVFPTFEELPYIEPLTDPFEWSDGSGRALEFKDWSRRRGEIAREIQHYEIGDKPAVSIENIEASMDGNVLTVKTTINGQTLTQTATINYPSGGSAPYPLMVGADNISLPGHLLSSRNIATMSFSAAQVNGYSQMGGSAARDFERLYPELVENGAYSEWAWGFSRLLDGLQILGPEVTKIDMDHIGVTGCSYAGKMALFCGAFDERVALTIPQESGGGGCAAWRVTRVHNRDYTKEDAWEGLDNTDYSWFMTKLRDIFGKNNTFYLPYDHHELCALCCPRGFLMLGNPDYVWLADGSGYISMLAARKVWERYGIADRCGYSIIGGHGHCQLPSSQEEVVGAYLDRFLLGKEVDMSTVSNLNVAPIYEPEGSRCTALEEPGQWMDWWESENHEPNILPTNKEETVLIWGDPASMVSDGCTDWEILDDETSPVGHRAHAVTKNTTAPTDANQALKFAFTSAKKQKYFAYAYVNCAKSTNDAVWYGFDENEVFKSNGANSKGEWAWKSLFALLSNADKTSHINDLDAGEHTLNIYTKEVDYNIGLICVSNLDKLDDFKEEVKDLDLSSVVSSIRDFTIDSQVTTRYFYSIDGRQLQQPVKGINIVRETLSDGQIRVRKIIF